MYSSQCDARAAAACQPGTLSAGNWPVTLLPGWDLPAIAPESPVLYAWFRAAHGALAWLLFAVVIVHLSAALMHAWVYRDGVFASMAGRRG